MGLESADVDYAVQGGLDANIVRSLDHQRAVQGREGWLFSEESYRLLHSGPVLCNNVVSAWRDELSTRSQRLTESGIRYIHIGVPDKLMIMSAYAQECDAHDAQRLERSPLRRLSAQYKSELACLIDPSAYLSQQKGGYPLYWKSDTRWTPWCSYMCYQLLCGQLNVDINNQLLGYPFDEAVQLMNLDDGMPADPESIRSYRLQLRSSRRYANELVRCRETQVAADNPLLSCNSFGEGSHVVFENRHAKAADLSIVLFGDSHSSDNRTLLTGMLAETFAEVHFVWGQGIDYDYVDCVKPDIVITQCSELSMAAAPVQEINIQALASDSLCRLLNADFLEAGICAKDIDNSKLTRFKRPVTQSVESEAQSTRVLFATEQYDLEPPLVVQAHGVYDTPETTMRSNELTLTEVKSARVYFTGSSWLVHDGNGVEALRRDIPTERKQFSRWRRRKKLDGTTLMFATSAGAHCYYHWMLEILPKLGLLEREGVSLDDIDHFLVREITGDWQLQTLARFGIDESRIVETINEPHLNCESLLHIDLNFGINLKMHRFIPQWMKHLYPAEQNNQPRLKLYITRPEGVRRGVTNESEFIPLLKEAGFTVMAMEGLSVAEQAALLARTDVIMSPHGGALTNMVFSNPGITVIELFSRHVFPYYYGLAANCGHRYYAILENPEEDYPRLVNGSVAQNFAGTQHETSGLSFDVSVDAIKEVLKQLAESTDKT